MAGSFIGKLDSPLDMRFTHAATDATTSSLVKSFSVANSSGMGLQATQRVGAKHKQHCQDQDTCTDTQLVPLKARKAPKIITYHPICFKLKIRIWSASMATKVNGLGETNTPKSFPPE